MGPSIHEGGGDCYDKGDNAPLDARAVFHNGKSRESRRSAHEGGQSQVWQATDKGRKRCCRRQQRDEGRTGKPGIHQRRDEQTGHGAG